MLMHAIFCDFVIFVGDLRSDFKEDERKNQ